MFYYLCIDRVMDMGILCFLFVFCYLLIFFGVVSIDIGVIIWEVLWNFNIIVFGKGDGILFGLGFGGWYKFIFKVY